MRSRGPLMTPYAKHYCYEALAPLVARRAADFLFLLFFSAFLFFKNITIQQRRKRERERL